ncbi:GDSL-type esterase/lipase family protein [Kitasatospora camelliae]|uniref:GDSL-type esterase/lipase family protein n=1 Tax=Kitasatospora camelliae TaxID=3156397 RepID=A0AAU8JUH7_9ACTN
MGVRRAGSLLVLGGLLLAGCSSGGSARPPAPAHTLSTPSTPATPATPADPSGAATPAGSPSGTPTPPSGPYVALGDSYTSGLAVAPQVGTPSGCGRSGVNYPALVARALGLGPERVRDASCSGARTADLTGRQQTVNGVNPPQLDALSADTGLVTLGIGANDAGFVDVIGRCAARPTATGAIGTTTPPGADGSTGRCRASYTSADGQDQIRRRLDAMGEALAGALAEIHRRAPRARVFVVGYPALLPADPAACSGTLGPVAVADLVFLAEKEQQLNAVLRERAEAAGAGYVDTFAPSAGHDMCAGEGQRWIEPLVPAPGSAPIHPNALGERGLADAVLTALR